jgi:hypothetical protein
MDFRKILRISQTVSRVPAVAAREKVAGRLFFLFSGAERSAPWARQGDEPVLGIEDRVAQRNIVAVHVTPEDVAALTDVELALSKALPRHRGHVLDGLPHVSV